MRVRREILPPDPVFLKLFERMMQMSLQAVISGLLLGGIYTLMASGFGLISGVMKIYNFSHGSLIMLGAFVTFWFTTAFGFDPLLTIPFSMIILFILGYFLQKYVLNLIVRAPTYMTLIFTFGLDMVIVNAALVLWTGNMRGVPVHYPFSSITLFGAAVPVIRLIAFGVAILVTVLLFVVMGKTHFGKAITAARMDLDAARLVGVNIPDTYAVTFGIGAALAGAAGSLISLLGPISPNLGVLFSTKAFAIYILGGTGSMLGPLVGGLLMGLIETVGVAYVGTGYKEAIPFALLIFVLVFRPRGILGKEFY